MKKNLVIDQLFEKYLLFEKNNSEIVKHTICKVFNFLSIFKKSRFGGQKSRFGAQISLKLQNQPFLYEIVKKKICMT